MPNITPNIGLTKPLITDNYDLSVWNANMDLIDSSIGGIEFTQGPDITEISSFADIATVENKLALSAADYTSQSWGPPLFEPEIEDYADDENGILVPPIEFRILPEPQLQGETEAVYHFETDQYTYSVGQNGPVLMVSFWSDSSEMRVFTYAEENVPEDVLGIPVPAGWGEFDLDSETILPSSAGEIGTFTAIRATKYESTPDGLLRNFVETFNIIERPAGLYARPEEQDWMFIGPHNEKPKEPPKSDGAYGYAYIDTPLTVLSGSDFIFALSEEGPMNDVESDGAGTLTVKKDGVYLVNFACCANVQLATQLQLRMEASNMYVPGGWRIMTNGVSSTSVNAVVSMTKNDTVKIWGSSSSGDQTTVDYAQLTIAKVG